MTHAVFVRSGDPALDKHLPWLQHNAEQIGTPHRTVTAPEIEHLEGPVTDVVLLDPSGEALTAVETSFGPTLRTLVLLNRAADPAYLERVRVLGLSGPLVLGPGSNGMFDVIDGLCLSIAPYINMSPPDPGRVWVVSQGGALVSILARALHKAGVGLARTLHVAGAPSGQMEQALGQFVEHALPDSVFLAYVEGLADPERFFGLAMRARRRGLKILALRAGTTAAGAALIRAHSSSVAGGFESFAARARSHAIPTFRSFAEAVEACRLLLALPTTAGGHLDLRPAIGSTSGGLVSLMLDSAGAAGLDLPELRHADQPCSPFDLDDLAEGADRIRMLRDEGVADLIVYAEQYGPAGISTDALDALRECVQKSVPIFVWTTDVHAGDLPPACLVHDLDAFWRALAELCEVGLLGVARPATELTSSPAAVHRTLTAEVYDHLAGHGVLVARETEAGPEHDFSTADRWVVKLAGSAVPHRGALQGVITDVTPVEAAKEVLAMRAKAATSGAGVYTTVQPQVDDVVFELLVAVHHDPHAGRCVVVGPGGRLAGTAMTPTSIPEGPDQGRVAAVHLLSLVPPMLRNALVRQVEQLIGALIDFPLVPGGGLEINPATVTVHGQLVVVDCLLI